MKKLLCLLMCAMLVCGAASALAGDLVGVSMPTKDLQRWNQDGANMEAMLKEAGYDVELQFASNDVATQLAQVETMIDNGAKVVVISAIEGSSLGQALDKAAEKGCKVIAYDRLLMDNENVD
ncbi:MAG: substrate-binding domain-containing protein, partial [Treponema sp.]|nr:substrate-binding domain-containing protein [Treponema sp.]